MWRSRVIAVPLILLLAGAATVQSVHTLHLRSYRGVEPICRVDTTRMVVALSFDDGPDPGRTPAVLELLGAQGARATFFVLGERAALEPSLLGDIVASGNELGNHTWSHPRLSELSEVAALGEFRRTQTVLPLDGGPTLVRAPFGEARADTFAGLWQAGMMPIHWSVAIDHFVGELGLEPRDAAATISGQIRAGDILLAHDAGVGPERDRAMQALRLLLPLLRARGFEVTTVGELLASGSAVRADPRPWLWQSGFTCPDPG
ncbi:MAG: polysaccharide deacetylase family protein [Solirubrobacterales bacterium]